MNKPPASRRSNEAALRDFVLELLVNMQAELLATDEGREQMCATYEWQAEQSHPAVASVLREAVEMVKASKRQTSNPPADQS